MERPTATLSSSPVNESNPLRMLRQVVTVRPKVRGNKHNSNSTTTLDRGLVIRNSAKFNNGVNGSGASGNSSSGIGFDSDTHQTLPRGFKPTKIPPPVKPKPTLLHQSDNGHVETGSSSVSSIDSAESSASNNPLPLPPRDRTKNTNTTPNKPRHQRKHPLIIPTGLLRNIPSLGNSEKSESSRLLIQHTHNPNLEIQGTVSTTAPHTNNERVDNSREPCHLKVPPAKPPRLYS